MISAFLTRRDFLVGLSTLPYAVPLAAQSLRTEDLAALRAHFSGELILPADAAYDTARQTNNRAFDRHPLLVARCADTQDVVRVLAYARSKSLPIAVRSGGHCQAGRSSLDGGVVIDLGKINGIAVDAAKGTVECGAGVRVYEVNQATVKSELALPLGICGDVGIAGLTLGGGYGYLSSVAGLACDSLMSAEVVLADGRVTQVSEESDPELQWALRGAGANFGIVTKFRYKAYRIGPIYGGTLKFPSAAALEVAQLANEFSASLPDELAAFSGILELPGKSVPQMSLCWSGDAKQGRRTIDRLITARIKPEADELKSQTIADLVGRGAGTDGLSCARYGIVAGKLPPAGVEALVRPAAMPAGMVRQTALDSLHGALSRRAIGASAAPSYPPGLGVGYLGFWEDRASTTTAESWVQSAWDRVHPFTASAYVNMLGDETSARVHEAYGANYARLAKLKRKYDPDNVFKSNQNIIPA